MGFDWEKPDDVWDKVKEEIGEVEAEMKTVATTKDKAALEAEFGDLFFALINAARLYKINPENALEHTNRKFIQRFEHIEDQARAHGQNLRDLTLDQMEAYWQEAKTNDK